LLSLAPKSVRFLVRAAHGRVAAVLIELVGAASSYWQKRAPSTMVVVRRIAHVTNGDPPLAPQ
jgi:hypothetical protein